MVNSDAENGQAVNGKAVERLVGVGNGICGHDISPGENDIWGGTLIWEIAKNGLERRKW